MITNVAYLNLGFVMEITTALMVLTKNKIALSLVVQEISNVQVADVFQWVSNVTRIMTVETFLMKLAVPISLVVLMSSHVTMVGVFRCRGNATVKTTAEMEVMKGSPAKTKRALTFSSLVLAVGIVFHRAGFVMETMTASIKLTKKIVRQ